MAQSYGLRGDRGSDGQQARRCVALTEADQALRDIDALLDGYDQLKEGPDKSAG